MEKKIPFSKLKGSGNDFLLSDNRGGILRGVDLPAFVGKVCDRSRSVGADGVIFIENSRRADFRWQFYNADGSRAEMCGNGGRCAARVAGGRGTARPTLGFETDAGLIRAEVKGRTVKLQMTPPHGLALAKSLTLGGRKITYSFLDTGVPHAAPGAHPRRGNPHHPLRPGSGRFRRGLPGRGHIVVLRRGDLPGSVPLLKRGEDTMFHGVIVAAD